MKLFKAWLMLAWVVVLMFAFVRSCHACDRAIVSGLSYHFDRSKPHNEVNIGVGCSIENWSVGIYRNSEWGTTAVTHIELMPLKYKAVEGGVLMGLAFGYKAAPIMPLLLPAARIELNKEWKLHVQVAPVKGGVVSMYFSKEWK